MSFRHLLILILAGACADGDRLTDLTFYCEADAECSEGFVCAQQKCRLSGSLTEEPSEDDASDEMPAFVEARPVDARPSSEDDAGETFVDAGSAYDGGARLPIGRGCASPTECLSGFCSDGICCDSACAGACDACHVQTSLGICKPVKTTPAACGSYLCNGITSSCPTSCTSSAGCIGTNYCAGGQCKLKVGRGVACTTAEMCSGGKCSQGFCCDRACSGVCERCDFPLSVGTCSTKPSYPAPSCAPYVCGGPSTCATSCASDLDCQAGTHCAGSECLAYVSALFDDFNDNVQGAQWVVFGTPAHVREIGKQLELETVPNSTGGSGYVSSKRFDARNSSATIELKAPGDQLQASRQFYLQLAAENDIYVEIVVLNDSLRAVQGIQGVRTVLMQSNFLPLQMKFLRLREAAGTVFFEWSTTGTTFTVQHSVAAPFSFQAVKASIGVRTFNPEATSSTTIVDNFNL